MMRHDGRRPPTPPTSAGERVLYVIVGACVAIWFVLCTAALAAAVRWLWVAAS